MLNPTTLEEKAIHCRKESNQSRKPSLDFALEIVDRFSSTQSTVSVSRTQSEKNLSNRSSYAIEENTPNSEKEDFPYLSRDRKRSISSTNLQQKRRSEKKDAKWKDVFFRFFPGKKKEVDAKLEIENNHYVEIQELKRDFRLKLEKYAAYQINKDEKQIIESFITSSGVEALGIHQKMQNREVSSPEVRELMELSDLKHFWSGYKKLSKKQQEELQKICQVELELSQHLEKRLGGLVEYLREALNLNKKAASLNSIPRNLDPNFDANYPISLVTHESILSAFRYLLANNYEEDRNHPTFAVNNQKIILPDLRTFNKEVERKKKFISWLIGNLNGFVKSESEISLEGQTELFFEQFEDENALLKKIGIPDKTQMVTHFQGLLDKHGTTPEAAKKIANESSSDYPKSFSIWCKKYLHVLLNQKDPEPNSKNIVGIFIWLELCNQYIPCFSILQALSINAYSFLIFKVQSLFPSLNPMRLSFDPQIKPFFHINIDEKKFEVDKIKSGSFIKQFTDEDPIGSTDVHWIIKGKLQQADSKFEATLIFESFAFNRQQSLKVRKELAKKLGII